MLRDGASRAPRPLYLLGYICDQPYFLIVVWTRRRSPTHLQQSIYQIDILVINQFDPGTSPHETWYIMMH